MDNMANCSTNHKTTTKTNNDVEQSSSLPEDHLDNVEESLVQSESVFASLYKYSSKTAELSQEQRRDQHLCYQKLQRHKVVDAKRNMSHLLGDLCKHDPAEAMDVTPIHCQKKKRRKYSIMLTEWMKELPSDYPHNWLAKFCPEGHRNLIVASKNVTKCFGRGGGFQFKFLSPLPGGGGSSSSDSPDNFTVLDCIYSEKHKIFFILDVIAWNGIPLYSYEADCRFFCLKSRFEELLPLRAQVRQKYSFYLLEYVDCDPSLIHEKMNNLLRIDDDELLYDGVVFYHKQSEYVFRETPLAVWLKSYMVPEMLSIDIHPNYIHKIPESYVNLQVFFQQKENKKKARSKQKKHTMDTS